MKSHEMLAGHFECGKPSFFSPSTNYCSPHTPCLPFHSNFHGSLYPPLPPPPLLTVRFLSLPFHLALIVLPMQLILFIPIIKPFFFIQCFTSLLFVSSSRTCCLFFLHLFFILVTKAPIHF